MRILPYRLSPPRLSPTRLSPPRLSLPRLSPPSGTPIGIRALWETLTEAHPAERLAAALGPLVGGRRVILARSGREALRSALVELAARSGRREVVVPAYTCFSVPAAAVAAGLRVRLVDVDARARIDVAKLAALPLEKVAAVVVCNLFGVPEPIAAIERIAREAGAAVVDDAAQSLGARAGDGPVGARGDVGVLSFARGKPLSGLGGGAVAWPADGPEPAGRLRVPTLGGRLRVVTLGGRLRVLGRALAYDAALSPHVFPWLARVPALRIGETPYEPVFPAGGLDAGASALAAAMAGSVCALGRQRAALADWLGAELRESTAFEPLLADADAEGVHPRLAVVAPTAAARERALQWGRELGIGASPMYPASLDQLAPLAPDREPAPDCHAARELARRLLTLPVHRPGERARLGGLVARLAAEWPVSRRREWRERD